MDIKRAIMGRRTVRRFKQQELEEAELRQLLDAGRVAPCGANKQRLRYIVVKNDKALLNAIFEHTAWAGFVQPARNPVPGETAPTAFLVLTCNPEDATAAAIDAAAAIENIQLMAYALGIGCCWIGAYQREPVDKLLQLDNMQSLFLVALGYPAEEPVMEDIDSGENSAYYLDKNDVLHVPKYRTETITEWR